jgi:Protein of unknown function (DUF2975)
MKPVPIISKILYFVTRLLAILYLTTFTHTAIAFAFKTASLYIRENGEKFTIFFPFTQKPFLLGRYNTPYIVFEFTGVLFFYGIFLWLLSHVFDTFAQPKLFTEKGYKRLKWFYLYNLIVPIVSLFLMSIYSRVDGTAVIITSLHCFLGIFAFFLAAIFKQGLKLQTEQDLII